MRGALFALLLATSGCGGYGLMQTAHTEPPGKGGAVVGANLASNKLSGVAGRDSYQSFSQQAAPRVGLSDHVDVGAQPWMLFGVRGDAKVDLLDPRDPLAVAPRVGGGYAGTSTQTIMAMAGGIVSYRLPGNVEPYLGVTYADHWIDRPVSAGLVAPGESLVPRNNTGDGLVQLSIGLELPGRASGFIAEYNLWLPANNDPGDGYAFVTTEVFAIGVEFFSPRRYKSAVASAPAQPWRPPPWYYQPYQPYRPYRPY